MKIKDLNKKELQKVTSMYVEERDMLYGKWSLEEFCECFIRRCDNCGELVKIEDEEELKSFISWRGEHLHVCHECECEFEEDSSTDYEYDEYIDCRMMERV